MDQLPLVGSCPVDTCVSIVWRLNSIECPQHPYGCCFGIICMLLSGSHTNFHFFIFFWTSSSVPMVRNHYSSPEGLHVVRAHLKDLWPLCHLVSLYWLSPTLVSQGLPTLLSPWPGDLLCNPLYRAPNPISATSSFSNCRILHTPHGNQATWGNHNLLPTFCTAKSHGFSTGWCRAVHEAIPLRVSSEELGQESLCPLSFRVFLTHQAGVGGYKPFLHFAVSVFLLHPTSLFPPSPGKKDRWVAFHFVMYLLLHSRRSWNFSVR